MYGPFSEIKDPYSNQGWTGMGKSESLRSDSVDMGPIMSLEDKIVSFIKLVTKQAEWTLVVSMIPIITRLQHMIKKMARRWEVMYILLNGSPIFFPTLGP